MFSPSRSIAAAGLAVLAIFLVVLTSSVWAIPFAKIWYEPGFEDAVEQALAAIPDPVNA